MSYQPTALSLRSSCVSKICPEQFVTVTVKLPHLKSSNRNLFNVDLQEHDLKMVVLNLHSIIIISSGRKLLAADSSRRGCVNSVKGSIRFNQHIIKPVSSSGRMPSILTDLRSLAERIWFLESSLGISPL
ncbi:hypothetical protein CesoFtcFv8_023904 [Champsocephalus esox]|uniref:Uncharacterized protein n=1 Tax=Champsocephalus esox TaxID=159716 RepID=A0AAN8B5R9_9TELE|nr:hypothetical protein CesoFtcFv8_023904 [Champsocephalus esox]